MSQTTVAELAQQWRDDLEAWAIPDEILAAAPRSPWGHAPARLAERADRAMAEPAGPTFERSLEALPPGGAVLDVGAGAGATSLPLADRAGTLIAVDTSEDMLAQLAARAGGAMLIEGRWPDVAPLTPRADVVVCGHVLYNVPDIADFVRALSDHARQRVVVEMTERHPMSWLNPLWKHFHDLDRPQRPTAEDAEAIISALGHQAGAEHWITGDAHDETVDELAARVTQRLCLPEDRRDEVAAAAIALNVWPIAPFRRVTLWWDRL